MMRMICFVIAGLLTVSVAATNNPSGQIDPLEISFMTSGKPLFDYGYQQSLRQQINWQAFVSENPSWMVHFNECNQKPHRAYGPPIAVNGGNPELQALDFINNQLGSFEIPVQDLVFSGASSTKKYDFVNFHQSFNGLKVLGSNLTVKLYNGQVVLFGLDIFDQIEIDNIPSIDIESATSIAEQDMVNNILGSSINEALFVLPIPVYRDYEFHLVYEVIVYTMDENNIPSNYQTFVDAHTGELLYRTNLVKHYTGCKHGKTKPEKKVMTMGMIEVSGQVTAEIYPTNLLNPAEILGLPFMSVMIDGNQYYTDESGNFSSTAAGPITADFALEGLYCELYSGGVMPAFGLTMMEGMNDVSFDADANIKELSTYRSTNVIHEHMKAFMPNFTALDNPMIANVDVSGTCNAFYDGAINFFELGGGCNATSLLADVVYHEYGHAINSEFYGANGFNFNNGAMGEGYSDIWGISITNNPILGQGFFTDSEDGIRRYDLDPKVYPQDIVGEVHADGEIICGAWYDSHLLMGEDWDLTMTLFAEAYSGFQATAFNGDEGTAFVDVLIDALMADDDDGDITNGTPNDLAIIEGFAIHGISLLASVDLVHDEILSASSSEEILIEATAEIEFPASLYLDGAKLYYSINASSTFTEADLSEVADGVFEAIIPAQDAGTVIGYYIGLMDTSGTLTSVQPAGANSNDANLPHFIIVGLTPVLEHDVDFSEELGIWETGVSGDNATAGLWELAIPVGSFQQDNNPETAVAAYEDHTPGTGEFCFVTGQSADEFGSIYDNDVDDGWTTLRSSVIDMSVYEVPVISYWRWFAHFPAGGQLNDGWIVEVSDDGGASWVTVESTATQDIQWRRNAFRVQDYVEINDQFRIQMIASDPIFEGSGALIEAAADDIIVWDAGSVGVDVQNIGSTVHLYPNPSKDLLNIELTSFRNEMVQIRVFDQLGAMVINPIPFSAITGKNMIQIHVTDLNPGMYWLSLNTSSGDTYRRFVVE